MISNWKYKESIIYGQYKNDNFLNLCHIFSDKAEAIDKKIEWIDSRLRIFQDISAQACSRNQLLYEVILYLTKIRVRIV